MNQKEFVAKDTQTLLDTNNVFWKLENGWENQADDK